MLLPEKHDVGFWTVNGIMHPSPTLLHPVAAPFCLQQNREALQGTDGMTRGMFWLRIALVQIDNGLVEWAVQKALIQYNDLEILNGLQNLVNNGESNHTLASFVADARNPSHKSRGQWLSWSSSR